MTAVLNKASGHLPADPKGDHPMSTITIPTRTSNGSGALAPADPNVTRSPTVSTRRHSGIGVLRMILALVWAVDAAFKWSFISKFRAHLTGAKARTTKPISTRAVSTAPAPRTAAPAAAPDDDAAGEPKSVTVATWRVKGIGVLRIIFGLVWLVDAAFKWSPSFINKFADYLTGAKDGQPQLVKDWIDFWVRIVNVDPHVFAHLVAIGETAVAIGLILGLFSNLTYATGALLATVIWTTAEGLGGPYKAGSTDIGAAIIYTMVFAGLYLALAGRQYGLDTRVGRRLKGRWAHFASGPVTDTCRNTNRRLPLPAS